MRYVDGYRWASPSEPYPRLGYILLTKVLGQHSHVPSRTSDSNEFHVKSWQKLVSTVSSEEDLSLKLSNCAVVARSSETLFQRSVANRYIEGAKSRCLAKLAFLWPTFVLLLSVRAYIHSRSAATLEGGTRSSPRVDARVIEGDLVSVLAHRHGPIWRAFKQQHWRARQDAEGS